MRRHWDTVHAVGTMICPQCPGDPSKKKLYSHEGLKAHLKYMHRETYECTRCDVKYGSRAKDLRHHYRIDHIGYKRYRCKICQSRLSTLSNARYHHIESHCKEFLAQMGGKNKLRMGNLPDDFWDKNDAIEDLSQTDPNYPSDDYIQAIIDAERINPPAEKLVSRKAGRRKGTFLRILRGDSHLGLRDSKDEGKSVPEGIKEEEEVDAAVQSIQEHSAFKHSTAFQRIQE